MIRAVAVLATTALAAWASFALLALLGPDWNAFAPATCMATACFCEAPRAGELVLQPANAWSSFGFVVLGAWIIFALAAQRQTAFAGAPAVWFALTAIVTGVGSFLLHASLTLWGQFADVLGMYLLSAFMMAYALRRWLGMGAASAIALYVVLCAVLIGALWAMPETRRWLFAIVLLVAIALELVLARPKRPGVKPSWFYSGLAANAVAFAIWILDNTGTLCAPHSLIQGHAIWHLLGAVAVYCSYRYYRSEQAPETRKA
jgi:hypothetical protein